jgi:hypothetical protein
LQINRKRGEAGTETKIECHEIGRYLAAFFCFAQRFRCAAAMRARASADKNRFFRPVLRVLLLVPASSALTSCRRLISESISARIWVVSIPEVYRRERGKHTRSYSAGSGLAFGPSRFFAPIWSGKSSKPDARTVIVQELDAGLFHGRQHLGKRGGPGADFAGEGFHPADCPYRHSRTLRKFNLFPPQQRSRRPQLPSRNHSAKLACGCL